MIIGAKMKMLFSGLIVFIVATSAELGFAEDGSSKGQNRDSSSQAASVQQEAKAVMAPKSGSQVRGTVSFKETSGALKLNYDLEGLPKNGKFGFHIHEKGDCSSEDAKSAGPHYVKVAESGGTSVDFPGRYEGDLPQIKSDFSGRAKGEINVTSRLSLRDENGIIGRAIIVHGGPDDVSKKSSPRIACGEIR